MEKECEGFREVNEVSNSTESFVSAHQSNPKETLEQAKNGEEVYEENFDSDKGNSILRLPLARIKKIMKGDPELCLASQDSVFLIAKATELFIESLVVESYQNMLSAKKKTIAKRDFDSCLQKIDSLAFLDGAIDELT